jgi:hypothetical protein
VDPYTLPLAFIGHMVGDYILQNDWMAQNKKTSSWACAIHSFVWTSCVVVFTGWGWMPFLILFAFHFLQDRTGFIRFWMNFNGQSGFATGPLSPWSVVIIDNTFHLLQIWLVWYLLGLGWIV